MEKRFAIGLLNFLGKKRETDFFAKKMHCLRRKICVFWNYSRFSPRHQNNFCFLFFFMKIERANSNSIPPLSPIPKRTYFSWKTMHFFGKKIRLSFFCIFFGKKIRFSLFFQENWEGQQQCYSSHFFWQKNCWRHFSWLLVNKN